MTATKNELHTYMRDAVPAEKCGQCPCCLKAHRSTARGTLIRHGWKETGRTVGSYGMGFQWGACNGWGMRPLEQTDADALTILAKLEVSMDECRKGIELHTTGAESYTHALEIETEYERTDAARAVKVTKIEAALTAHGVAFTSTATTIRKAGGFRVVYHKAQRFAVTVARGAAKLEVSHGELDSGLAYSGTAFSVPSYEGLRKGVVSHLAALLKAMQSQRDAIKAAVKHHAANPSTGQTDTKRRGNLVHFEMTVVRSESSCAPGTTIEQRTTKRLACGKRSRTMRGHVNLAKTDNREQVTCGKCLKSMPK